MSQGQGLEKILVSSAFKLNSPAAYPLPACNLKSFAVVGGVYEVSTDVAEHPYTKLFSSIVAESTPATATYSIVSF